MNPAQLLSHFDRISDAPDAISRLRRFILDLAVRGKLVEQDPRDEPASELLKRIQDERRRHHTDGTVRKKAASQIDASEMPFDLPESWVRSSLAEVASYGLPEKVDSNKAISANTWVLDLEDIEKDTSRLVERVLSSSRPFHSSKTRFNKGDVLFGKLRPYLNKVLVADTDGVCTTEIIPIRGFGGIAPEYIRLVLKSPLTMKRIDRLMYGMKMPRLGTDDALGLNFPLPPLAEQPRIVAKVDEMIALCDRLETARAERESRRDRLTASSLHRLNNGADPDAFRDHARFYFNHLPRLTTKSEHILQLRQTILNLAVRGKLVPQDPHDEPAAELLKRIQAEKVRLVNEGTIKSLQPALSIGVEEIPSAVPDGWEWVRVRDLLLGDTQNGYSRKPDDALDGIPILRISAGTVRKDGVVAEEEHKLIGGVSAAQQEQYRLQPGDLLACRFNGNRSYVGRLTIYLDYLGLQPIYPDKLIRLRLLSQFTLPKLVRCFAESSVVRRDIENYCATTVGNWGISASNLKEIKIPLPPLAEQERIVAKVDELMALCDRLEAQLTTTQTESGRLLEAVLHEALALT
jgi:type I restriction enzyme S subunit